jgi:hypothetical protein
MFNCGLLHNLYVFIRVIDFVNFFMPAFGLLANIAEALSRCQSQCAEFRPTIL